MRGVLRRVGPIVSLAAVAGLALALLAPSVAIAAAGGMQYSTDGGSTWSSNAPAVWFTGVGRLVPGDTVSQTVQMRSTRTEPTLFQFSVNGASIADPMLKSGLTLKARDASGAGLANTAVNNLGQCDALVPNRVLRAGDVVPVTLTLQVSPDLVERQGQNSVGSFQMAVNLSDPGLPTAPNGCPVDAILIAGFASDRPAVAGGSTLAYTGSSLGFSSALVALAALGLGGMFVVIAGRRRRRGDES